MNIHEKINRKAILQRSFSMNGDSDSSPIVNIYPDRKFEVVSMKLSTAKYNHKVMRNGKRHTFLRQHFPKLEKFFPHQFI